MMQRVVILLFTDCGNSQVRVCPQIILNSRILSEHYDQLHVHNLLTDGEQVIIQFRKDINNNHRI